MKEPFSQKLIKRLLNQTESTRIEIFMHEIVIIISSSLLKRILNETSFPVTIMPNNITTLKEANNNKAHQTKLSLELITLCHPELSPIFHFTP